MWGKAGESSPVVPQHQGNRVPWFLNAWRMRGAGWSPGWVALALPTCQACTCPFRARWLGVERVQYCRHCQAPWLETTCPLRLSACAQAEPGPLPGEVRWLGGLLSWRLLCGAMLSPAWRGDRCPETRAQGLASALPGSCAGGTGVLASAWFGATFNSVMIRFAWVLVFWFALWFGFFS